MTKHAFRLDARTGRFGRLRHEQLKSDLVNEMITGRLRAGQLLPSESQFAQVYGVTRKTVRRAMASLENDGLVRREQGRGNFVEQEAERKLDRGLDIFALVVPETHGGFYPSLLYGFEAAGGEIHYQTLICSSKNDVSEQANVILQLMDKNVSGVALVLTSSPPTPAFQVRQLQERGIPVVFCHRRVEGVTAPLLAIPFFQVGRLAGRTLAERGHRRVAFVTHQWSQWTPLYEEGLREGLQAGGCNVPAESVVLGKSIVVEEETAWAALQKLFAKPDPPTAIFASFDTVAEVVYLLLPKLGLHVPEDVSLIGMGGALRQGAIPRRLTSVVVDEVTTGQKAVSLLHEMRRGERPIDDNEEFLLHVDLYQGETLAAPAR